MTVAGPLKPLLPTPVLSYAGVVSSCEALAVDATSSTGSGGRYGEEDMNQFHHTSPPCINITQYC